MSVDAEIRRLLTERRMRSVRPPDAPMERYQIRSKRGPHQVPLERGKFTDERGARSRMEKLRPKKGDCYTLFDILGGGPHGRVLAQKGDCEEPKGEFECAGGCLPLDAIFERRVRVSVDGRPGWPGGRQVAARRLWLQWLKKLKMAASKAHTVGWGKSSFAADFSTRQLRGVLKKFCRGQIPMPQEEAQERFAALFELVLPGKTMGYPTGLAYTAQPVGSPRGTGVSPSAAGDIESGRFQNYLDAGTIKSRKPGSKSSRIGGGKVVQHQKARS